MYLTVYMDGRQARATAYVDRNVLTRVLDNCLGTAVFTLEDTDEKKLIKLAKEEARRRKISFVKHLDDLPSN